MKTDLKKIIKSKGYTLSAFAEKVGISKQALNSIVNGNPTISSLETIADACGCTVSELLQEDNITTPTLTCPKCGAKLNISITAEEC